MFIEKTSENSFWKNLEKGINKNASFEGNFHKDQIKTAVDLLLEASTLLKEAGLNKESDAVAFVSQVCSDPHTEGLTSEQMVENLKEKGIVFNANDMNFEDEDDEPLEVEDKPYS